MIQQVLRQFSPQVLLLGVGLLMGLIGPVHAEQPSEAEVQLIAGRLVDVDGMQVLMETCPADIWETRKGWRHWFGGSNGGWGTGWCQKNAAECINRCIEGMDGSACGAAAHTLERYQSADFGLASRRAFALACSLGNASGCTNRAAGIRNSPIAGDALSQDQSGETAVCLARSFAIACSADDAWGCVMEGQGHWLGEGTPPDLAKAEVRFIRTCTLHPGPEKEEFAFAPCRFANELRQRMQHDD